MKKLVATTALIFAVLALSGCASEATGGTRPEAPSETTEYFSDTVDIYFTDGQKLNCLIDSPGYEDSTLACNWRGMEAVGNLEIANESEYIVRYINYKGESTPCIFSQPGTSYAVASCGFGYNANSK